MKLRKLYEILVPCKFEDNQKPVRTKHHKKWDHIVRKYAGGMTILKPAMGQWVNEGKLYLDRVIPVRICCTEKQMQKIANFTLQHYRQKCVMYYTISNEVTFLKGKDE